MNIIVTGGAGFIGSNFVYLELEKHPEDRIICLDKLTYAGNLATLGEAMKNPNFRFVKGDIADKECVEKLFEEEHPDIIVNFAAESHVDRSIEDPGIFLKTNIMGTQVLMDACRKYGIKRYHQVSTDEVYGDLPLDKPDLFFTEETPIHTSSPYSASKAGADLLVMAYHRTFGLPVTITRCSNNYGPYHFPEKLIPLIISRALANETLPVYGKGENEVVALNDVSFSVKKGEFVAIMGESGSGKTTLLNILATLDKPTSGDVLLDGKSLGHLSDKEISTFRRKNLGFVFQDFNLLDTFSLRDNIYLPLVLAGEDYREMGQKIRPIAQALHIYELLEKYPYEVSGGQKQRCAVARALITQPRLVLADEPTGALDSKAANALLDVFGEINRQGQTILMVTHSAQAASRASRVLFIKDGEVFHQIYRGEKTKEEMYQMISDTLTILMTGGEYHA